ncbi:hexokinase-2-like [Gambusia affinis]|uniref:hexokinase-2-like n=1 Tax=Gambusia affinis TaxID=33528 RepID=UPI001CDBED1A|nr:hexokinase-2-like [Gambusia affinis]
MSNFADIPSETAAGVEEVLEPFRLSDENLKEISNLLLGDMIKGLSKNSEGSASVKMFQSHVTERPNGTEEGDFLALDLGGTKLRVFHVKVTEGKRKLKDKEEKIPEEKKKGSGEELFDYIVECLSEFLVSQNLTGQTLPLGFSFSFPCNQETLEKSILKKWTKGFQCSGVEGKDVAELLKQAIKRKGGLNIDPIFMVNDAVATMMGFEDQNCEIGMIIGTGTNACYMEEMKNIEDGKEGQTCINTEWCAFGDDGSLDKFRTNFDKDLDINSENKGEHIVEKMISGKYLGEIVRLVLKELKEKKLLFKGKESEALRALDTKDMFETKFISMIEEPDSGLENAKKILTKLGLMYDLVDASVVRLVCKTISSRSAHLCAVALATMANRIRANRGLPHLEITVGMDGSVYNLHPTFSVKLKEALRSLSPECNINIKTKENASGIGAAMVAAVGQRLR